MAPTSSRQQQPRVLPRKRPQLPQLSRTGAMLFTLSPALAAAASPVPRFPPALHLIGGEVGENGSAISLTFQPNLPSPYILPAVKFVHYIALLCMWPTGHLLCTHNFYLHKFPMYFLLVDIPTQIRDLMQ